MSVTGFDQLNLNKYYTYQDYLSWTFPERVELFMGKVLKMSPAPNRMHQEISRRLTYFFDQVLWGHSCKLYAAPFDVRLPVSRNKNELDTVVQPDIVVICDPTKLDDQGCNGAPDIIVEILSPGNSHKEMKEKFELYEASLVREYWIVDPAKEYIVIYTLNEENKYVGSKPFVAEEVIKSTVIKEITVEISEVFRT